MKKTVSLYSLSADVFRLRCCPGEKGGAVVSGSGGCSGSAES